ncbi:immunity 49 family protein [Nocardiopsis terrae]
MYIARPEIMRQIDEEELQYNKNFMEEEVSSLSEGTRGMHHMVSGGGHYQKVLEFLALDPRVEQRRTWEMWLTSMQFHHAYYQVAMAEPYTRVDCLIDGRMWNLGSTPIKPAVNASSWTGLMYKTLTCRSVERARFLAQIPIEVLREVGESDGTRYTTEAYARVSALQAFVSGAPEAEGLIERAWELADPQRAAFAADEAKMISRPELETLGRLAAGDGPGFNDALVRALEAYRDHTAEELAAGSTKGIIPLQLLALACLAKDGFVEGVSLEVESDYLPAGIVNGVWLDAFPV